MKTYTKEQITKIWNLLIEDEKKKEGIMKWMALMFEEQYPPFLNFYNPLDIVKILDKKLEAMLSYVFYECRTMKWGGWVTHNDWKKCIISWDLKGMLAYCKFEWILEK